jgi:hypothetical protein
LDRWQVVLISEDKLSFTNLHPTGPVSYPELEQQKSAVLMIAEQTVAPVILRVSVHPWHQLFTVMLTEFWIGLHGRLCPAGRW